MRTLRSSPGALGAVLVVAIVVVTGCADELTRPIPAKPTSDTPALIAHADTVKLTCTVVTATREMTCGGLSSGTTRDAATNRSPAGTGARTDRVIGGQDTYVQLASTGFSYNSGTQTFSLDVTVQNLLQSDIGTPDGTTVDGLDVFLTSDPVTIAGTGTVTASNPDGRGTFTASNQPYWHYCEILEPYEISQPRTWTFAAPATVQQFRFTAYVVTPLVNEAAPLLDAVWTGATSTAWSTASNWAQGAVPVATSVVAIPSAALLTSGNFPQLSSSVVISGLRVGQGSSLNLNANTLSLDGNVDAIGAISNGTVRVTGPTALIGGSLPALEISGTANLQRAVVTTGRLVVTGSLVAANRQLVVTIP